MIKCIVAVDKYWKIGKTNPETGKGELLFKLPLDLKHFKRVTSGNIVAMGYQTLLSLPGSKPLPNRVNVVLCPEGIEVEDCICLHDFDETVSCLENLSRHGSDVFIIGGAMFYKSMLPYCDLAYVTKVDADGQGEVDFPNLDKDPEWKLADNSDAYQPIEDNDYTTRFCIYERVK